MSLKLLQIVDAYICRKHNLCTIHTRLSKNTNHHFLGGCGGSIIDVLAAQGGEKRAVFNYVHIYVCSITKSWQGVGARLPRRPGVYLFRRKPLIIECFSPFQTLSHRDTLSPMLHYRVLIAVYFIEISGFFSKTLNLFMYNRNCLIIAEKNKR